MSPLPPRFVYAIAAVADIAANQGPRFVPNSELEARLAVRHRFLEPSLQALVNAGILKSAKGLRGGYKTAMTPDRITLARIVEIVDSLSDAATVEFKSVGSRDVYVLLITLSYPFRVNLASSTIADLLPSKREAA